MEVWNRNVLFEWFMNGIVHMKAPKETGVDCQDGWYQWPRTQSAATELVKTQRHKQ